MSVPAIGCQWGEATAIAVETGLRLWRPAGEPFRWIGDHVPRWLDDAEQSNHPAPDLIPLAPRIAGDLSDGVVSIQIDSSGDKTYFLTVASPVLSFTRTVSNGKVITHSCLQLKSAGKTYCTRKTDDIPKSLPAS